MERRYRMIASRKGGVSGYGVEEATEWAVTFRWFPTRGEAEAYQELREASQDTEHVVVLEKFGGIKGN